MTCAPGFRTRCSHRAVVTYSPLFPLCGPHRLVNMYSRRGAFAMDLHRPLLSPGRGLAHDSPFVIFQYSRLFAACSAGVAASTGAAT